MATTADVRTLTAEIAQYTSGAVGNVIGSSTLSDVTAAESNLWIPKRDANTLISQGVDLNGAIAVSANDILTQIGILDSYLLAAEKAIQAGPAPTFIALPDSSAATAAIVKINSDLSTINGVAAQIDAGASAASDAEKQAQATAAAYAADMAAKPAAAPAATSTPTTSTAITTTTSTPLPAVPATAPVTSAPPPAATTTVPPAIVAILVGTGALLVGMVIMHAVDSPKPKPRKRSRR